MTSKKAQVDARHQAGVSASPVQVVLDRHNIDVSEHAFAEALDAALTRATTDPPVTEAEAAFFAAHAGVAPLSPAEVRVRMLIEDAERQAAYQRALTTRQAADLCGVDPSTMRHWVSDRKVLTVSGAGNSRLPQWQFVNGQPLPALAEILAALPPDMHPADVHAFLVAPRDDLVLGGDAVSAVSWLVAGGDPTIVVHYAQQENVSA